ncbi:MAG: DUF3408 domain-containing protein [Tannerella sp.]|jgi:hypothetical protein|nr:DUF3408 domain-containing protein [Tannerella sp.]
MATKTNSRAVEGIDETFLLNSIMEHDMPGKTTARQTVEEREKPVEPAEPAPEKPKESVKRRRSASDADYGSRFLQRNEFKTRQCVYVSQRIHTAISEIVQVISDRDVTVGGYVDSILMEHLEMHREEITDLYNRELSKRNGRNLMGF